MSPAGAKKPEGGGDSQPYAVRDVPGKGRGLVAERDFPLGELLLDEAPLFRAAPQGALIPLVAALVVGVALARGLDWGFDAASLRGLILVALCVYCSHHVACACNKAAAILHVVRRLTDSQRGEFYKLYSGFWLYVPLLAELRIFHRNAVSDDACGCVCVTTSRINHSCVPNAAFSWHAETGRHQVHALRHIARGEEINASYVNLWQAKPARRTALRQVMGFLCACHVCSTMGEDEQRLSDARREQCGRLERQIAAKMHQGRAREALRDTKCLRDVAAQELGVSDSLILRGMDEAIAEMQAEMRHRFKSAPEPCGANLDSGRRRGCDAQNE